MSLSQKLPTGWFLSVPIEEGSETFAYKWVEIDGSWLFVSNRHNDPCTISLNLAMVNHYPTNNPNYSSNSLTIECNGIQGFKSVIFSTLNRFDLLAFNTAISEAKTYWENYITDGNTFEDYLLECSDITSSTIGVDAEISIVQNRIHIKRVLSDPEEIPIKEITRIVPTLYDPFNGIAFELVHNSNSYLFKARKHKDMIAFINAVQCIHSTMIKPQAGISVTPQVIQISQPVMIEGQSQPQVMVFQLQQPLNAIPPSSPNTRGNQPAPLQVASFVTQPLIFPAGTLPSPQEVAQIVTQSIPQLLQQSQGIQNTQPLQPLNLASNSSESEGHNSSHSILNTPPEPSQNSPSTSSASQNTPSNSEASQDSSNMPEKQLPPTDSKPSTPEEDNITNDEQNLEENDSTEFIETSNSVEQKDEQPQLPSPTPAPSPQPSIPQIIAQPPNILPPSIEPPPMEEEEYNDPFDEEEFF